MKVILTSILFLCVIINTVAANARGRDDDEDPDPITIINLQELNFGTTIIPTRNVDIIVNRNGRLNRSTSATMVDTSDLSGGLDRITGDKDNNIQIDFSQCGSNGSMGLRLTNFKGRYGGQNFTRQGRNLKPPRPQGRNLSYGATLQIRPSVTRGIKRPCYEIEVTYD